MNHNEIKNKIKDLKEDQEYTVKQIAFAEDALDIDLEQELAINLMSKNDITKLYEEMIEYLKLLNPGLKNEGISDLESGYDLYMLNNGNEPFVENLINTKILINSIELKLKKIRDLGGEALIDGDYIEITLHEAIQIGPNNELLSLFDDELVEFITSQNWYEFISEKAARIDLI